MNKTPLPAVLVLLCCACSNPSPSASVAELDESVRPLPEGEAKAIVENACSTCHDLDFITAGNGHTPDDWKLLTERMVTAGAPVEPGQVAMVTDYLTNGFPERNIPPAVIVPGSVQVSFKEWTAPTGGSRPHDPWASRDGASLWYTGQYASALGRVNMTTGEITEFRTPTPGSGPHGLTEGPNGDIWFTANARGYIGRLDPKSGKVTEYPLPEGELNPWSETRS